MITSIMVILTNLPHLFQSASSFSHIAVFSQRADPLQISTANMTLMTMVMIVMATLTRSKTDMLDGIGMMRTCAWNDGRPIELVTRMADNSQAISLFCHRPCYDHHHNGDGDDEEDRDDVDDEDMEMILGIRMKMRREKRNPSMLNDKNDKDNKKAYPCLMSKLLQRGLSLASITASSVTATTNTFNMVFVNIIIINMVYIIINPIYIIINTNVNIINTGVNMNVNMKGVIRE